MIRGRYSAQRWPWAYSEQKDNVLVLVLGSLRCIRLSADRNPKSVWDGRGVESNIPVVSRLRAMSLEESSPIRDVHVASSDESEERERDDAKQKVSAVLAL